jgi:hypothetical protein
MIRGWVRLWRKALDNEIIKDQSAWHIFTWLLLKVDRITGKKKTGRFWASDELGMKPNTFYKALKRLEKKYKVVTLQVTGKFTEISLINWHKYQTGNTPSNTSVTHGEHIGNTSVTLYKNKEVENKELRIEKEIILPFKNISFLINLPIEVLKELSEKYICNERQIKAKAEQLYDYCHAKGRAYKDYKAFLRNALSKDFGERIEVQPYIQNLPQGVSEVGLEKLRAMKQKILGNKLSSN